jgi:hypothetical protein
MIQKDTTLDINSLTSVFVEELVTVLTELSGGDNLPKMFPSSPLKCKT